MQITAEALYREVIDDLESEGLQWKHYNPEGSPRECAAFNLARNILKKYEDFPTPGFEERALEKFLATNIRCKDWEIVPRFSWEEEMLGDVKTFIDNFLHPRGFPLIGNLADVLPYGRLGPGASLSAESCDFYGKMFGSRLSTTSRGLYVMYKNYIQGSPRWLAAEEFRALAVGDLDVVGSNRISFVPKDRTIARTICTEPSLNMFYQLGLAHILVERLNHYGIDLVTQQSRNRRLACIGSRDGTFSTIDLSSASDSLSLKVCRWLFPRWFQNILELLRSPSSSLGDQTYELYMVSTMGNGYTFPVQTLVFLAVVFAAFKRVGKPALFSSGEYLGNFGVNGDDIVVPTELSRYVIHCLQLLGFQVNGEKTFTEGPFRESCGGDYFRGRNVRSVYIKTLMTQQDRYTAINLLNRFTARTDIRLRRAVSALVKTVRFLPIPFADADASGIKVPSSFIRERKGKGGSSVYTAFRPMPYQYRILEDGFRGPVSRRLLFNPEGLYCAALQGTIYRHKINVRNDIVKWRTKRFVTPYWDYVADRSNDRLSWQRWETAVFANVS